MKLVSLLFLLSVCLSCVQLNNPASGKLNAGSELPKSTAITDPVFVADTPVSTVPA